MPNVRRICALSAPILLVLAAASCDGGGQQKGFAWEPVFGDNFKDNTPVVARVAGVEITEQDIDLRFDELPKQLQGRYRGDEGRRLLLKDMINQVLLVRGAVDLELYNDRNVARTLISQRRSTLDLAMRGVGLLEKAAPSEEQLREYFMMNRDRYRQLGTVRARHVECLTRADAEAAYERLRQGGKGNTWPAVVAEVSVNEGTKKAGGELGWFNPDGFVPDIPNAAQFTTIVYGMPDGLNPPVEIGARWHVIENLQRQPERPMTYAEARDKVLEDIKPSFQEGIINDWLAQARQQYPPELLGQYAPGRGLSAEEIFARAMALPDNQDKIDLFQLIVTDFPASDRADDALFMSAQIYLDRWGDRRAASIQLDELVKNYPESELVDDAQFMLENLDNPSVLNPKSIEDLRR